MNIQPNKPRQVAILLVLIGALYIFLILGMRGFQGKGSDYRSPFISSDQKKVLKGRFIEVSQGKVSYKGGGVIRLSVRNRTNKLVRLSFKGTSQELKPKIQRVDLGSSSSSSGKTTLEFSLIGGTLYRTGATIRIVSVAYENGAAGGSDKNVPSETIIGNETLSVEIINAGNDSGSGVCATAIGSTTYTLEPCSSIADVDVGQRDEEFSFTLKSSTQTPYSYSVHATKVGVNPFEILGSKNGGKASRDVRIYQYFSNRGNDIGFGRWYLEIAIKQKKDAAILRMPVNLTVSQKKGATKNPCRTTFGGTDYSLEPCPLDLTMFLGEGNKDFSFRIAQSDTGSYLLTASSQPEDDAENRMTPPFPADSISGSTRRTAEGSVVLHYQLIEERLKQGTYGGSLPIRITSLNSGASRVLSLPVSLKVDDPNRPKPDLVFRSLTHEGVLAAGVPILVRGMLLNSGSVSTQYTIEAKNSGPGSDMQTFTGSTCKAGKSLKPGESCEYSFFITYSSPGLKTLKVLADPEKRIEEFDESNNSSQIKLNLKAPNLKVENLAFSSSVSVGEKAFIRFDIVNAGDVIAQPIQYSFTRNGGGVSFPGIDDTCVAAASLKPGGKCRVSEYFTFSSAGTKYLSGLLDPQYRILESGEDDNGFGARIQVR